MPRIGRYPSTPTMPARFVTGVVLAALVVVLDVPASAQQGPSPGQTRTRAGNHVAVRGTSGRTSNSTRARTAAPPADPAAAKARELLASIDWQQAPEIAGLGVLAEFRLPRNYVYTGPKGAKTFLEVTHYPAPKELLGILAPYGSFPWFVVFEAKAAVQKDDPDRKPRPDADALLRTLRAENDADNAIRRTRGWTERTNLDWEKPPAYDARTGNLTWTTRSNFGARRVVRTTTRTFGKKGAIDAHLVASPKDLPRLAPTLTNFVALVEFTDGPNGGMRRNDLGGGNGDSSGSTTTAVTYTPTPTYTAARSTGSIARSPRTIGGFITAFTGAMGAAFKRKKKSA